MTHHVHILEMNAESYRLKPSRLQEPLWADVRCRDPAQAGRSDARLSEHIHFDFPLVYLQYWPGGPFADVASTEAAAYDLGAGSLRSTTILAAREALIRC